jgi:hypothetical protein
VFRCGLVSDCQSADVELMSTSLPNLFQIVS